MTDAKVTKFLNHAGIKGQSPSLAVHVTAVKNVQKGGANDAASGVASDPTAHVMMGKAVMGHEAMAQHMKVVVPKVVVDDPNGGMQKDATATITKVPGGVNHIVQTPAK